MFAWTIGKLVSRAIRRKVFWSYFEKQPRHECHCNSYRYSRIKATPKPSKEEVEIFESLDRGVGRRK